MSYISSFDKHVILVCDIIVYHIIVCHIVSWYNSILYIYIYIYMLYIHAYVYIEREREITWRPPTEAPSTLCRPTGPGTRRSGCGARSPGHSSRGTLTYTIVCHIVLEHIKAFCITLHYIISYHITLCYIILYQILYYDI